MVFNFIESGINLFDDTFNTIKDLFSVVLFNNSPTRLSKCYASVTGGGALTLTWELPNSTWYQLYIEPTVPRVRLRYNDGTTTSIICTFTVS